MTEKRQQPKRGRGRPRTRQPGELPPPRRSLSIDKTDHFMTLLNHAHWVYQQRNGRRGAHSKVIAAALALYIQTGVNGTGQPEE